MWTYYLYLLHLEMRISSSRGTNSTSAWRFRLGSGFANFSCVRQTSRVGYHDGKSIERTIWWRGFPKRGLLITILGIFIANKCRIGHIKLLQLFANYPKFWVPMHSISNSCIMYPEKLELLLHSRTQRYEFRTKVMFGSGSVQVIEM